MSVSNLWVPYAVSLNTATLGAGAVLLDQIQNFEDDPGINLVVASGDGQVDPTYVAVMSQRPTMSFGSSALATILGACGISGAVIDADGTYPGLVAWYQKMAEGGIRASGSAHLKMTAKEGLLIPTSVTAQQDGTAMVSVQAGLTYDGTNAPIVVADSQALSGSPAVGEMFTVGPVSINGATLEGIQSISFDPGLSLVFGAGDGDVWPTYVSVQARRPRISVVTTDVSALATLGISGAAQGASDSVVWFRKKAEGGTLTADATAEHISLTMDDGMAIPGRGSVTQDGHATREVTLVPSWDGTNAIIVISTAAAIA